MPGLQSGSCDKPRCPKAAEKTYKGKHGNTLELCGRHYYRLVAGSKTPAVSFDVTGTGTDIGRLQPRPGGSGNDPLREPPNPFEPDSDPIQ